MKRPLFVLSIYFSTGIFTAHFIPFEWLKGLAWVACIFLSLIFFIKNEKRLTIVIYSLFFVLGGMLYLSKIYFPNENRIDLLSCRGDLLRIRGRIDDFITMNGYPEIIVDVRQCESKEGGWRKAQGKALIRKKDHSNQQEEWLGEIEVSGIVKNMPLNPYKERNQYSYWLRAKNIALVMEISDASQIQRLEKKRINLFYNFINDLRDYCSKSLSLGLSKDSPAWALLQAMIIGSRQDLDPQIRDSFLYTNTIHILSISGLHLSVILFSVIFVLGFFSIPRRCADAIALLCIWIYAILTGLMPPIQRSAIMASFFLVGRILRKKTDLNNSLGAAALMMLGYNPFYLFDVGFQLTFLCLFSLSLLTAAIENDLKFLRKTPPEMTPFLKYKKDRYMALANEWFLKFLSGSIAVWIGVLPVIAYHFQLFSPITILANLVAVPCVGIIMNLGFVSCLLGFIPWIAPAFNTVNELVLLLLIKIMDFFSSLPGAFFFIEKPSIFWLLMYYGVILFGLKWGGGRLKSCYFFILAVAFIFFLRLDYHPYDLNLKWCSYQNLHLQLVSWPEGQASLWIDSKEKINKEDSFSKIPTILKTKKVDQLFLSEKLLPYQGRLNRLFYFKENKQFHLRKYEGKNGLWTVSSDQKKLQKVRYRKIEIVWINQENEEKLYGQSFSGKTLLIVASTLQREDSFLKKLDRNSVCAIIILADQKEILLDRIANRGIKIYDARFEEVLLSTNGTDLRIKH